MVHRPDTGTNRDSTESNDWQWCFGDDASPGPADASPLSRIGAGVAGIQVHLHNLSYDHRLQKYDQPFGSRHCDKRAHCLAGLSAQQIRWNEWRCGHDARALDDSSFQRNWSIQLCIHRRRTQLGAKRDATRRGW